MNIQEERQRQTLLAALHAASIGYGELWVAYMGRGGAEGQAEVEAHIHGLLSLPPTQRDLLAAAANELIDALPPLPRAAYSDDPHLRSPTGTSAAPPK